MITGTNITGSATAPLFSGTPWSSGNLDAFLGISASPTNPIGAFIPDSASPGATSLFVYQLSLSPAGGITLQGPANPNVSPLWNFTGGIPKGSYIVGFLNEGTAVNPNWVATSNSGAILATSSPPTVPEPSSIVSLGIAILLGLAAYRKGVFGGQDSPKTPR